MRTVASLIFGFFSLVSLNAACVVNEQNAVVPVGSSKAFTTTGCAAPVTWSLVTGAYNPAVGSIGSSTGVYTAPPSVVPKSQNSGCMSLPDSHIYNQRIDALPLVANNSLLIGANLTVTAATNSNPVQLTVPNHGLALGTMPQLFTSGATAGWAALNNNSSGFQLTVIDANTVSMAVDTTNTTTFPQPITGPLVLRTSGTMSSQPIKISSAHGTNIATMSTPTRNEVFHYTGVNNGSYARVPYPDGFREGGWRTMGFAPINADEQEDQLIINYTGNNCQFQDIYHRYNAGDNVQQNDPAATAQSGVKHLATDFTLNASATSASGVFVNPLIVRESEIFNGVINHALKMTLSNYLICNSRSCGDGTANSEKIWPATAVAGGFGGLIPYGSRFRLQSSFPISTFSVAAQMFLLALQNYGAIMTDGGSVGEFAIDADTSLGRVEDWRHAP